MNKRLIIGKNSKIVNSLHLSNSFEIISHSEAKEVDYSNYSRVYLFSWYNSPSEMDMYRKLYFAIAPDKLVFISTIAVDSLQLRDQWNFYPNHKKYFEDLTLSRGGAVIRIGIYETNRVDKLFGALPITSKSLLENSLLLDIRPSSIYHCYKIINKSSSTYIKYISLLLHWMSLKTTKFKILNIILQGVAKKIGLSYYGYTADCLQAFADEILIGKGILGSVYLKYNNIFERIKCIASNDKDITLNYNGFNNTIVGKTHGGLGNMWHGVLLMPLKSLTNSYRKIVPIFVNRPLSNGYSHKNVNVESIKYDSGLEMWVINCHDKLKNDLRFYSNKVTLAAGPVENTRLLVDITNITASLSDHEIAMVGTCLLHEAECKGYVKKSFGLLFPGVTKRIRTLSGIEFLFEVRPYVPSKHALYNEGEFYIASNISIVKKLLKSFDRLRLNEAIFNKFGVGFATKKMSVFVQALSADCIYTSSSQGDTISFYKNLNRKRITRDDWYSIKYCIHSELNSFVPDNYVTSIDALHIMGGKNLRRNDSIQKMISSEKLKILGSPTELNLDALHHTAKLINNIIQHSPILIFCPEINPNNSPHYEHSLAISKYHGNKLNIVYANLLGAITQIFKYQTIYFQKTSILNIPLLALARMLGKNSILYLHEPLKLQARLRKGVPLLKSLLVSTVHCFESLLPNKILTGNELNRKYFFRHLIFAPLIYQEAVISLNWTDRKSEVLYFGRLDSEKFFREFSSLNIKKQIIATSNLNINEAAIAISRFTIEEKNSIFLNHKYVWCAQRNNFSQSGVLLDAIRFGCVVIISKSDPLKELIDPSRYIALPSVFNEEIVNNLIESYEFQYPLGPKNDDFFSKFGGADAFENHWRKAFEF